MHFQMIAASASLITTEVVPILLRELSYCDWYQPEKSWTSILWGFDTWDVQRMWSLPQSPAASTIGAREDLTRGILGSHSRPWWMETNKSNDGSAEVIENWHGLTTLSVLFCFANPQPPGSGRQEKSSGQHDVSSQHTPFFRFAFPRHWHFAFPTFSNGQQRDPKWPQQVLPSSQQ